MNIGRRTFMYMSLASALFSMPNRAFARSVQEIFIEMGDVSTRNLMDRCIDGGPITDNARIARERGMTRMGFAKFRYLRDEKSGTLLSNSEPGISVAPVSAIRPDKVNDIVYCCAVATDVTRFASIISKQNAFPFVADNFTRGGFKEEDRQLNLLEEANLLGLNWAAHQREINGWSNQQFADNYFPIAYLGRDKRKDGSIRTQTYRALTKNGSIESTETVDYATASGHINLKATLASGEIIDERVSFS